MIPIYDNALPADWEEEELRRVTLRKRGYSWAKEDEADRPDETTVPVLRIPNIQERLDLSNLLHIRNVPAEALRESAITKGWILFVGSNGNPNRIGDSALMTEDREMIFASFLMGIASKDPERITPEFLAAWLRLHTVHEAFSKTSQQTTGLANFSWSAVKRLPVRYPKKRREQDAVTKLLDAVDAALDAAEAKLGAARRLKTALMQQLFTRGVPGRHTRFQQTKVGEIPDGWEVRSIGELTTHIYRYPTYYDIEYVSSGVPEVRGELLLDNGLIDDSPSKLRYISEETAAHFPQVHLEVGDVVMSVRGTLGKVGIVPPSLVGGVITANLIRLCPNRHFVIPNYLSHALLTRYIQGRIDALSGLTTIKTITAPSLKRIEIAYPSIVEQEEIVALIEAAEANVTAARNEIAALERLKHSLLQNLLTGRVRVRVEP